MAKISIILAAGLLVLGTVDGPRTALGVLSRLSIAKQATKSSTSQPTLPGIVRTLCRDLRTHRKTLTDFAKKHGVADSENPGYQNIQPFNPNLKRIGIQFDWRSPHTVERIDINPMVLESISIQHWQQALGQPKPSYPLPGRLLPLDSFWTSSHQLWESYKQHSQRHDIGVPRRYRLIFEWGIPEGKPTQICHILIDYLSVRHDFKQITFKDTVVRKIMINLSDD